MLSKVISRVRNIFVGRDSELEELDDLWALACKDEEHMVYVFLNAPGVGKTTLINFFGKSIESEGKGLFIKLICSSDYDSPANLNKNLIETIEEKVQTNRALIEKYIKQNVSLERKEWVERKFKQFLSLIDEILTKSSNTINDIREVFMGLSRIIPFFFAADEIQEFQKLTFRSPENESNGEETALHYFTKILKNLLNSRVLLVLSGTRYHILSQIGSKIGSPIRQKVKMLVIQQFNTEEIIAYIEQVKDIIEGADIKLDADSLSSLLENYRQFIFAFSGGHPRTISIITERFLTSLSVLASDSQYLEYERFMTFLLPLVEKTFKPTLLSEEEQKILIDLSSNAQFSIVKNWILNGAYKGQFLGQIPEIPNNPNVNNEIDDLVYNLMNIGFIVQNGNFNYHITSYFHFLSFLTPFNEPHEVFLRQVLHNKYFKLMCGDHAGFGFTFENILAAALILHRSEDSKVIPLNTSFLKSLKVKRGKLNFLEVTIKPNLLYQTPMAESIDAFILQEKELLLIQITTANPPNPSKIDALMAKMESLTKMILESDEIQKIQGWHVSLFSYKKKMPTNENIIITAGDQLIPLLGEELCKKLKEVKNSFSSGNSIF